MVKFNIHKFLYGIFVIAAILLMFPKFSYNDPDTFWHIELGQYMIEHGQVLHHAIHTFTEISCPTSLMNSDSSCSLPRFMQRLDYRVCIF